MKNITVLAALSLLVVAAHAQQIRIEIDKDASGKVVKKISVMKDGKWVPGSEKDLEKAGIVVVTSGSGAVTVRRPGQVTLKTDPLTKNKFNFVPLTKIELGKIPAPLDYQVQLAKSGKAYTIQTAPTTLNSTYKVALDKAGKAYTFQTVPPMARLEPLHHKVQIAPGGNAYTITSVPSQGSKLYNLTVPATAKRVVVAQPFIDTKKLINSLTGAQRASLERRGYLTYSELSPDQKKMISVPKDGEWTISYSSNGESIKIKSR